MKLDVAIAGATFREEGTAIVATIPVGQRYRLEREPSNPYDGNAVQIWVDDFAYGRRKPKSYQLGYVPQKWSGTVSAALKNNRLHVWAVKVDDKWGTVQIKWVDATADPL